MEKINIVKEMIFNDGFKYTINKKQKSVFTLIKKQKIVVINDDILDVFNYDDIIILYEICKSQKSIKNIISNTRTLIGGSIRKKGFIKKSKTYDILGCTYEYFKLYIESKFEPWMTWENYGRYNGELNYGWDLDHIIPISISKTEDDIIKLNHYTNLQPLCSKVNRYIKRNKLDF